MTTEDQILEELRMQTRSQRAQLGLLSEIKYELQNARVMSENTYKIKVKESLNDRLKRIFK